MSLKSEILKELEANRKTALSGQFLAMKFKVSRNAVWKTINLLKSEGYEIISSSNKGYRLAENNDLLSAEGITNYLPDVLKHISVLAFKEIDSTNDEAKRQLALGDNNTKIIVSETQTAGRGRQGRHFYSPAKTGIYMTMIIHPNISINDSIAITTATSVAVVRAIERLMEVDIKIKWVNDLYLKNKKLCGILTEAITDFETRTTKSVIIGIGINITTSIFPNDLIDIATSLNPQNISRNKIVAEIAKEIILISNNFSDKSYMKDYREHSLVLGKQIDYFKNGDKYNGKAIGIDDDGGLVVQKENGATEVLRSGEISVRLS